MSNSVSFSKYPISLSVSVDLVSFIACAIILSATYSIQAWFSGGLPYFLVKAATKVFEAGCRGVIPDRRPRAAQIAFAGGPGIGGVEVEADDRVGQAELGILLDQVGDLVAGKVAADHVGLGLTDLQKIRAEIGTSVATSSSPIRVPPLASKKAFAARSRSWPKCNRRSA